MKILIYISFTVLFLTACKKSYNRIKVIGSANPELKIYDVKRETGNEPLYIYGEKDSTNYKLKNFTHHIKELPSGLYVIIHGRNEIPLYVSKNSNFNVTINALNTDSVVYGGNNRANNEFLLESNRVVNKYIVSRNLTRDSTFNYNLKQTFQFKLDSMANLDKFSTVDSSLINFQKKHFHFLYMKLLMDYPKSYALQKNKKYIPSYKYREELNSFDANNPEYLKFPVYREILFNYYMNRIDLSEKNKMGYDFFIELLDNELKQFSLNPLVHETMLVRGAYLIEFNEFNPHLEEVYQYLLKHIENQDLKRDLRKYYLNLKKEQEKLDK